MGWSDAYAPFDLHASVSHEDATIQEFKEDPHQAAAYLSAVLEDGDQDEVLLALRRITTAFGSISKLVQQTVKENSKLKINFGDSSAQMRIFPVGIAGYQRNSTMKQRCGTPLFTTELADFPRKWT